MSVYLGQSRPSIRQQVLDSPQPRASQICNGLLVGYFYNTDHWKLSVNFWDLVDYIGHVGVAGMTECATR